MTLTFAADACDTEANVINSMSGYVAAVSYLDGGSPLDRDFTVVGLTWGDDGSQVLQVRPWSDEAGTSEAPADLVSLPYDSVRAVHIY